MNTDITIINPEIDHTVEIGILLIEVEETLMETIDQIIEVDHEKMLDMMIGETVIGEIITDRITEGTAIEVTIGKIMDMIVIENRGTGIEVQVGITAEVTTEIIQGKDLSEVEILVEIGVGKDSHNHNLEQNQKIEEMVIGQDQSQGRDLVQV